MTGWTDAHNHLQDARLGDSAPVIAAMRAAGVTRCVVNATRELDWPAVAALARANPELIAPAFGIHPWHAHTTTDGWPGRLACLLESHPHASLGECGLDQWVASPPMDIQRRVFRQHLELARDLQRPLTIHCLKAWGPLLDMLAEMPPPAGFLMHAFGGSLEIARRLIPLGAWFSFSGHFLHPRKAAVLEMFRKLPPERILVETDAPAMCPPDEFVTHPLPGNHHHPANLPAIGRAFAAALAISPDQLADLTRANATSCFRLGPGFERPGASE
jgi:TatD DNase family protein